MKPFSVRRRPAFSLRTLFGLVTLIGVWLSWNLHVTRGRAATLELCKEQGIGWAAFAPHEPAPISWVRRAMGDVAIKFFVLPDGVSTSVETAGLAREFPEAQIAYFRHN